MRLILIYTIKDALKRKCMNVIRMKDRVKE